MVWDGIPLILDLAEYYPALLAYTKRVGEYFPDPRANKRITEPSLCRR